MKLLQTISDNTFFPNTESLPVENKEVARRAVRAVLYNDQNQIAMVGDTYLVLPGGGMNDGESYQETIIREIKEELGCEIDIVNEIGKIVEYRNKVGGVQESYCFIAKVKKSGIPMTTQKDEVGMKIMWFSVDGAMKLLDKEMDELTEENYHSYFNIEVSRLFLKHLLLLTK